MRQDENNKGKTCWVNDHTFCQESFCRGCEIFQRAKICGECGADLDVWEEMMHTKHRHFEEIK